MVRFLLHLAGVARLARDRRDMAVALSRLSDHLLADIGIEREGIEAYSRGDAPWPALMSTTASALLGRPAGRAEAAAGEARLRARRHKRRPGCVRPALPQGCG